MSKRMRKKKRGSHGGNLCRSIVKVATKIGTSLKTVSDIPKANEFIPIGTVQGQPGVGDVMVGSDLRLYRRANGILQLIVPCEPREKTKPTIWFSGLDKARWPSLGQLATLYDKFLSLYNREVMYVIGELHDGSGFLFMVPKQKGDDGSIQWEDLEGMDWFAERAKFVGTVHIHPSESCTPSTTDTDDWKDPVKSGVHIVFGRKEDYTISASIAGHVLRCGSGSIKGIDRVPTTLYIPPGRTLEESLKINPPPKTLVRVLTNKHYQNGHTTPFNRARYLHEEDWIGARKQMEGVADCLLIAGAHPYKPEAGTGTFPFALRMVEYDGHMWLMSENSYVHYLDLMSTAAGDQKWVNYAPAGRVVIVTGVRRGR